MFIGFFVIYIFFHSTDGRNASGETQRGPPNGERAVPERYDPREARGGGVGGPHAPRAAHVRVPPLAPQPLRAL